MMQFRVDLDVKLAGARFLGFKAVFFAASEILVK